MCVMYRYIYIYIYKHIYMNKHIAICIYIYIYTHTYREPVDGHAVHAEEEQVDHLLAPPLLSKALDTEKEYFPYI